MPLKERLGLSKDPIYLIDGTAFVYRAFYAFSDMKRSDGFPTNALFIMMRLLLKILREEKPKYLAFVMDGRGTNFRHELFDAYKAQRSATPEALIQQIEPIQEGVSLLGIPVQVSEACEADDILAGYAARFKDERPVVIVGADKDLKQCLDENVLIWDPGGKKEKLTTLDDFTKETGLTPQQWPDYQAVIGDSSDNIPGIPGVGPKTADKLFAQFPTLEALKEGMGELKPKQRDKIAEHIDDVFLYRELTTLRTDMCMKHELEDFKFAAPDMAPMIEFLHKYEFRALARDIPQQQFRAGEQLSLFGDSATPQAPKAAPVKKISDAAALPDMKNTMIGAAPGEKGVALAVGADEYLYTGDVSALADVLDHAELICCPDVKAALAGQSAFAALEASLWFDLGLAAYLLAPEEREYTMEALVRHFGPELEETPALQENPARCALMLGELLSKRVRDAGLEELMQELEAPLAPVLARMEKRGISVDINAFSVFLNEVQAELDTLTEGIYEVAGGPFNIRSSQQLAQLLFETLELKPAGKTPGGSVSTSQAVLEKLVGKHPVVEQIIDFRKLEKMRSTYLAPLPKLVDKQGRLHTTFNQLSTATGRLSSSNPNLQNIPIRGAMGVRMRSCFIAPQGRSLVAADYSQIELRVLAHLSQEPTLLGAFRDNEDIHSRTAGLLYEKAAEEVSTDERRNAKTVNFGLLYGMGPQKLARDLKITLKEAKEFIERYFSRLSMLRDFYAQIEETAKEQGFVSTMAGRRRILPDINSRNNQLQSQARRQAVNTVVQGSAADIIKLAMLAVDGDKTLEELGASMLLQVHDELVLEAPEENAAAAGERVARLMSEAAPEGVSLDVPLTVDWGVGANWAQAH